MIESKLYFRPCWFDLLYTSSLGIDHQGFLLFFSNSRDREDSLSDATSQRVALKAFFPWRKPWSKRQSQFVRGKIGVGRLTRNSILACFNLEEKLLLWSFFPFKKTTDFFQLETEIMNYQEVFFKTAPLGNPYFNNKRKGKNHVWSLSNSAKYFKRFMISVEMKKGQ